MSEHGRVETKALHNLIVRKGYIMKTSKSFKLAPQLPKSNGFATALLVISFLMVVAPIMLGLSYLIMGEFTEGSVMKDHLVSKLMLLFSGVVLYTPARMLFRVTHDLKVWEGQVRQKYVHAVQKFTFINAIVVGGPLLKRYFDGKAGLQSTYTQSLMQDFVSSLWIHGIVICVSLFCFALVFYYEKWMRSART